jgi:hypothetical protein
MQYHLPKSPLQPLTCLQRQAAFSALAFASLLSACGGGGGGGEAPATPMPSAPTATLQSARAVDTAALSAWLAERTLMVAQLAGDELRGQSARGGLTGTGISCNGVGTRDLVVEDRDGSLSLNVGDRVHLQFNACRTPIFEGRLNGSLEFDVVPSTLSPANDTWAADLSTSELRLQEDAGGAPWVMRGSLHAESRMHFDGVELHAFDRGDETLVWERGAASERMLDFKLGKTLDYVKSTGRVDIAFSLESDSLGGRVIVTSGSDGITGWIGRQPDAGILRITGGKGEVTVRPDADDSVAEVGFDGDTNGVADGPAVAKPWSRIAAGFLWWAQGLVPLPTSPGAPAYPIPAAGQPEPAPYLLSATDDLPLKPSIEWAFSVPLDPDLPDMVLEEDAPGATRVPLDAKLRGARLTLVPQQPLQPGSRYLLRMLRNGASQVVELHDKDGDLIVLVAGDEYTTR